MLKTTGSTEFAASPKKTKSEVSGNNVVGDLVGSGEATNPTKEKN